MPRNPRPSEIAQTIERAADYIQQHGWTRELEWNDRQNGTPPAGLVGSLYQVTRSNNTLEWAYVAIDKYLYDQHMPPPQSWNWMQRDRRKVIRNMRKCARQLRKGELSLTTTNNF